MPTENRNGRGKRSTHRPGTDAVRRTLWKLALTYVVIHAIMVGCLLPLAVSDVGVLTLRVRDLPERIQNVIDYCFDLLAICVFASPIGLVTLLILWGTFGGKYEYLFAIDLCATVGHWVAVVVACM